MLSYKIVSDSMGKGEGKKLVVVRHMRPPLSYVDLDSFQSR